MKKRSRIVKGALLSAAIFIGGVSFGNDQTNSCSALKVIEKAKAQGIVDVTRISYSLGVWKVEGLDSNKNEIEAKISCPQENNSKASVIKVAKASHVPMSDILAKVKKLTSGKIKLIEYNGFFWDVKVMDNVTELEFQFDKRGKLVSQLTID